MTDSLRHLITVLLSEEIIMPNTPFGDPDSQIRKEESYSKLCTILT